MAEVLKLSPKLRAPGLFVYCNTCKGEPKGGVCCKTGSKSNGECRQVFKVRIHISGTSKRKRTQVLNTRDPIEAAKQAMELRGSLKLREVIKGGSIETLVGDFLEHIQQPSKNKLPISKQTRDDYTRHLNWMLSTFREAGTNTATMKPSLLNNKAAQLLFDRMKMEGRTKKKYFSTFRVFYNYLLKERSLPLLANPFYGWNFDQSKLENRVISKKEFTILLRNIETAPRNTPLSRRMYYDWLSRAFRFGLYSGARRQEIPLVRWSDIVYRNGRPTLILLKDMKNTRIKKSSEVLIKPIEINQDMAELLDEMRITKMRTTRGYLFAPEMNRDVVKNILSRSFGYYAKLSHIDAQFKCLRKTWFTRHAAVLGPEAAAMLGGHAGVEVTQAHYINKIAGMNLLGRVKRIFEG